MQDQTEGAEGGETASGRDGSTAVREGFSAELSRIEDHEYRSRPRHLRQESDSDLYQIWPTRWHTG